MCRILLINPSKWGRGITPIWIASHASMLKSKKHKVSLFDGSFYSSWSDNEIKFNTENKQYKKTTYESLIKYKKENIFDDLQKKIIEFKPDIIFWSAISSHIHGEGEYVNIQYGYDLLSSVDTKSSFLVTGGIQATADPEKILNKYSKINAVITGESEEVITEIAEKLNKNFENLSEINGLVYKKKEKIYFNKKQKIIKNLDIIPHYDYSLFEDQVFLRAYNGNILRAVDYEMSRGCVFTCSYCVETIVQSYYGFNKNKRGVLSNSKGYLRNKSPDRVFEELKALKEKYNIDLVRCQDTNFLTIDRDVLLKLGDLLDNSHLDLKLYIETRPEGINDFTVQLLKKLKVDGVGMGIEVSTQGFREESLNRFASQEKIINAFDLLKKNNIKRTAYNIIGLPNQNEEMIIETINFNRILKPDNITVAYYSPYYGTLEQKKSYELGYFSNYEKNVDGQIRSLSKSKEISLDKLNYYKKNFVDLVYER